MPLALLAALRAAAGAGVGVADQFAAIRGGLFGFYRPKALVVFCSRNSGLFPVISNGHRTCTADILGGIEQQPFDTFNFRPTAIAVYQLGNKGMVRMELKSWTA